MASSPLFAAPYGTGKQITFDEAREMVYAAREPGGPLHGLMGHQMTGLAVVAGAAAFALQGLHQATVDAAETLLAATPPEMLEPIDASIPDRVSIDEEDAFFWPSYRKLGVRVDGELRPNDVVEFCVSEGWARVWVRDFRGRVRREQGRIITRKITGVITPFYRAREANNG